VRALQTLDPDLSFNEKGLWDILSTHRERRWIVARLRRLYPINSLVDFPQWHLPAVIVRKLVGARRWNRLFSFAFVRNPWDLVVSAYHFELRYAAQPHFSQKEPDRAEALRRCEDFSRFVKFYPLLEPTDVMSMIADDDGRLIVDFVGRYETLADDFAKVCRHLGFSGVQLPHENRSDDRRSYRSYYTSETRKLVERYFARDIEQFGYRF
jgi:Sulfotransferase family